MKILRGSKIEQLSAEAVQEIYKGYSNIVVDLGTGDGAFPYRRASKNSHEFCIGLDIAADNMMEYAVKACKKPARGGLSNVLYTIGNALDIPQELENTADQIYINLPWGSLRDAVVKGEEELLRGITKIAKDHAALNIYATYCSLYEAKEMESRQLPELSLDYINTNLKVKYHCYGIQIKSVNLCCNESLKGLDTHWAKKLAYGRQRDIYHLNCIVRKIG